MGRNQDPGEASWWPWLLAGPSFGRTESALGITGVKPGSKRSARKMPVSYSDGKIMSNNPHFEAQSGLFCEVMSLPSSQRNVNRVWVASFQDSTEKNDPQGGNVLCHSQFDKCVVCINNAS